MFIFRPRSASLGMAAVCASLVLVVGCAPRLSGPLPGSAATVAWQRGDRDPVVPATIGGHAADALLDTGFSGSLHAPHAQLPELGLGPAGGSHGVATITGAATQRSLADVPLVVGGVSERIAAAEADDFKSPTLGLAWLRSHAAVIDCRRQLLAWPVPGGPPLPDYAPEKLRAEGYAAIALKDAHQLLWMSATLAGRSTWFVVDTGAESTVIDRALAKSLAIERSHPQPANGIGPDPAQAPVAMGQTRPVHLRLGDLDHAGMLWTVDLGPLNRSAAALVAEAAAGPAPLPVEGILGMDLLMAYQAILDVGRGTLYVRAPRPADRE